MKNKIGKNENFFSQLSHDIRGSFTSILGFSNILSDPNEVLDETEVREFGTRIGLQANDSLELLVNFINWLKLEKYNSLLSFERLELSSVVSESINSNRKNLENANITPVIDLKNPTYVFIDYEILISILNNIIKFVICYGKKNSELNFSSINQNDITILNISSSSSAEKINMLKEINFSDPNSENAFPLMFAIKFIELSGGELNLFCSDENISLKLHIPRN